MSNYPTQEYIDDLDRQMRELRAQLRMLLERKDAALISAWDIQVGDLVRNTGSNQSWTIGKVTSVKPPSRLRVIGEKYESRPWLKVATKKKDGSFSKMSRHTFDRWEKISLEDLAA